MSLRIVMGCEGMGGEDTGGGEGGGETREWERWITMWVWVREKEVMLRL